MRADRDRLVCFVYLEELSVRSAEVIWVNVLCVREVLADVCRFRIWWAINRAASSFVPYRNALVEPARARHHRGAALGYAGVDLVADRNRHCRSRRADFKRAVRVWRLVVCIRERHQNVIAAQDRKS